MSSKGICSVQCMLCSVLAVMGDPLTAPLPPHTRVQNRREKEKIEKQLKDKSKVEA